MYGFGDRKANDYQVLSLESFCDTSTEQAASVTIACPTESACRHLLQYQAISSVWHERRFVAINLPEPHLVEVVKDAKSGQG